MKPVTPYGKADDLAHQNGRLVQALHRERKALAIERARIKAVEDVLDQARDEFEQPDEAAIRRALEG